MKPNAMVYDAMRMALCTNCPVLYKLLVSATPVHNNIYTHNCLLFFVIVFVALSLSLHSDALMPLFITLLFHTLLHISLFFFICIEKPPPSSSLSLPLYFGYCTKEMNDERRCCSIKNKMNSRWQQILPWWRIKPPSGDIELNIDTEAVICGIICSATDDLGCLKPPQQ